MNGCPAARDGDVLAVRGRAGELDGALDSVGDEAEARPCQLERLPRVVREYEDRSVEWGLVAPPSPRARIVLPAAAAPAEHLPAHDVGACGRGRFFDQPGIVVRLAAGATVLLAPARRLERPLVQALPVSPERLLQCRVRPGHEPVERGRDVDDDLGHAVSRLRLRPERRAARLAGAGPAPVS